VTPEKSSNGTTGKAQTGPVGIVVVWTSFQSPACRRG